MVCHGRHTLWTFISNPCCGHPVRFGTQQGHQELTPTRPQQGTCAQPASLSRSITMAFHWFPADKTTRRAIRRIGGRDEFLKTPGPASRSDAFPETPAKLGDEARGRGARYLSPASDNAPNPSTGSLDVPVGLTTLTTELFIVFT